MPRLRELAARAEVGRADVIPAGLPPGSDVGNMAILGFDPARYHTGRAPIEAAAMGVELGPDEVAYRCNLVTVSDDDPPMMVDFAAGHLTSEQSHPIVAALDAALGGGRDGVRFHPGVEYRHLVRRAERLGRRRVHAAARPHRHARGVPDRPVGAEGAARSMDASRAVVPRRGACGRCGRDADLVVGPGREARAAVVRRRRTASRVACRRRSTSCRGSVCSRASTSSTFPARPPASTTTTARRRDACLQSLADRDFFLVHVEATDEAGHQGLADVKVDALERWDADVIGPIVDALDAGSEPFRILLLPDHATPCTIRTHTRESVPVPLLRLRRVDGAGGVYTEPATASSPPVRRARA